MSRPIYRRPDQCLFCTSRRCGYRIVAIAGGYDEVACRRHVKALEADADARYGGVKRHISSTANQRRGGKLP